MSAKRIRVDENAGPALPSVLRLAKSHSLPLALEFSSLAFASVRDLMTMRGCSKSANALVVNYLAQATALKVEESERQALPMLVATCRKLVTLDCWGRWTDELSQLLPRLIMNNSQTLKRVSRMLIWETAGLVALSHCAQLEELPRVFNEEQNGSCMDLFIAHVPRLIKAAVFFAEPRRIAAFFTKFGSPACAIGVGVEHAAAKSCVLVLQAIHCSHSKSMTSRASQLGWPRCER